MKKIAIAAALLVPCLSYAQGGQAVKAAAGKPGEQAVKRAYPERITVAPLTGGEQYEVAVGAVNVRDPQAMASIVGYLKQGDVVTVIGYGRERKTPTWYVVRRGPLEGAVAVKVLKKLATKPKPAAKAAPVPTAAPVARTEAARTEVTAAVQAPADQLSLLVSATYVAEIKKELTFLRKTVEELRATIEELKKELSPSRYIDTRLLDRGNPTAKNLPHMENYPELADRAGEEVQVTGIGKAVMARQGGMAVLKLAAPSEKVRLALGKLAEKVIERDGTYYYIVKESTFKYREGGKE